MNLINKEQLSSRETILEAALEVIAENKISGTRMREIAQRAGMSTGTLNYHFATKDELLQSLLDEMNRVFNEDRAIRFAEMHLDAKGKLQWFLDQERQLLIERRELLEVFIDFWGQGLTNAEIGLKIKHMYTRWRGDIEATLDKGMIAGQFTSWPKNMVAALMVSLMEGAALQYLIDADAFDLRDYFNAALQMVLCYLHSQEIKSAKESEKRRREPYPSDMSADDWQRIEPLIHKSSSVGRPRDVDMREVVNAILYVNRCGCSWRMLPHDFPRWQSVYRYFRIWQVDGTWKKICHLLNLKKQPGSLIRQSV